MCKHHVALDLDGTLTDHKGWQDENRFGALLPYARLLVIQLMERGHKITIFTAREDHEIVRQWLRENALPPLPVTNIKKHDFTVFIDDRTLFFAPIQDIDAFIRILESWQPWWKK